MATAPNFQKPPAGLGSYLSGILPEDIAVAAGGFAWTIQQIKNIKNVDFERFAQVAASIEVTNANLNLINGTDVPVDIPKALQAAIILQLGSGPTGTYTASDFFGCMSGLPYSWRELQTTILAAQTTKLENIYSELFLAVTWEAPTVTPTYTTYTVGMTTYYTITGITITDSGGGYGRGTAPQPLITFSNGGTCYGTFGTDKNDAQSEGGGTYGRLTGFTNLNPGTDGTSVPTIASIEYPPTATLSVQSNGNIATGGSNSAYSTAGWPGMNTVVQGYIDQANIEIRYISQTKSRIIESLNAIYNYNGTQLEIEQRARYQALDPVPLPDRNRFITHYPTTITAFVDNIGTTYAHSTRPHMYAQTLEAIADLTDICGQSLVGLMRQERNRERLEKLPVPLDNTVPCDLDSLAPMLISNGTAAAGKSGAGIPVTGVNGNPTNPTTTFTPPASLVQKLNGPPNIIAPKPAGYFDPNTNTYIKTNNTTPIDQSSPINKILNVKNISPNTNTNLLGPVGNGTGPAVPKKSNIVDPASVQSGTSNPSLNQVGPIPVEFVPIAVVTTGTTVPTGTGAPLDEGKSKYPGSLAGSPATNILPPQLKAVYTSAVLLPSTLTTQEAIDEVIKCNCDCWVD